MAKAFRSKQDREAFLAYARSIKVPAAWEANRGKVVIGVGAREKRNER